jgi:hypothetical protein
VEIEVSSWIMVVGSHMYFQFEALMDSRVALLRKKMGGKGEKRRMYFLIPTLESTTVTLKARVVLDFGRMKLLPLDRL